MNTIKSLGRWALPLLGIYMILVGLGLLFGLNLPALLMGILALVIGVLLLLNT